MIYLGILIITFTTCFNNNKTPESLIILCFCSILYRITHLIFSNNILNSSSTLNVELNTNIK